MRGINKIFTDAKENMFESFLFWFLRVQSDSTYQPRSAEPWVLKVFFPSLRTSLSLYVDAFQKKIVKSR